MCCIHLVCIAIFSSGNDPRLSTFAAKSAPAKKTTTKSSAAPTPAKRTKATSSSTGKQQRTKRITSWLLVGGEPTFKKNLTAQTVRAQILIADGSLGSVNNSPFAT